MFNVHDFPFSKPNKGPTFAMDVGTDIKQHSHNLIAISKWEDLASASAICRYVWTWIAKRWLLAHLSVTSTCPWNAAWCRYESPICTHVHVKSWMRKPWSEIRIKTQMIRPTCFSPTSLTWSTPLKPVSIKTLGHGSIWFQCSVWGAVWPLHTEHATCHCIKYTFKSVFIQLIDCGCVWYPGWSNELAA